MNANRTRSNRPCATTHAERQQQRVLEVRRRVLKARARNHMRYNPLETLNNLSILGLVVLFCAFAVGAI